MALSFDQFTQESTQLLHARQLQQEPNWAYVQLTRSLGRRVFVTLRQGNDFRFYELTTPDDVTEALAFRRMRWKKQFFEL